MKCDICGKDYMWLIFIGKDNVCSKCISKYTVFKEVKHSNETRLRLALRKLEIKNFDDLKKIKNYDLEELDSLPLKKKQTVKFKKNIKSAVKVDAADAIDLMSEQDQLW